MLLFFSFSFLSKENAVLYYYYYRQRIKKITIALLTGFGTIIIHEEGRNRNVKISILLGVNRFNFFFRFQALLRTEIFTSVKKVLCFKSQFYLSWCFKMTLLCAFPIGALARTAAYWYLHEWNDWRFPLNNRFHFRFVSRQTLQYASRTLGIWNELPGIILCLKEDWKSLQFIKWTSASLFFFFFFFFFFIISSFVI